MLKVGTWSTPKSRTAGRQKWSQVGTELGSLGILLAPEQHIRHITG